MTTSFSIAGDNFVTLHVGKLETPYRIHSNLLCAASPFFKAAFESSCFKEGQDRSMQLPDDDLKAFDRIVQFLYTGHYHLSPSDTVEYAIKRHWQMAKLYVLADKYDYVMLKNDLVDKLYNSWQWSKARHECSPPMPLVSYLCENTSEHSPFRKLLIAWLLWYANLEFFELSSTREYLCLDPGLAADLAIGFRQKIGTRVINPYDLPRVVYNEAYTIRRDGSDKAEGGR